MAGWKEEKRCQLQILKTGNIRYYHHTYTYARAHAHTHNTNFACNKIWPWSTTNRVYNELWFCSTTNRAYNELRPWFTTNLAHNELCFTSNEFLGREMKYIMSTLTSEIGYKKSWIQRTFFFNLVGPGSRRLGSMTCSGARLTAALNKTYTFWTCQVQGVYVSVHNASAMKNYSKTWKTNLLSNDLSTARNYTWTVVKTLWMDTIVALIHSQLSPVYSVRPSDMP